MALKVLHFTAIAAAKKASAKKLENRRAGVAVVKKSGSTVKAGNKPSSRKATKG